MFDDLVKIRFSNEKCHEKILNSMLHNAEIKNETFYIFYLLHAFVIICRSFLMKNYAWFGHWKKECQFSNKHASMIKFHYLYNETRIFCYNSFNKYILKHKNILPCVIFF